MARQELSRGLAARARHDMTAAREAIARAARADPDEPTIALAQAQIEYETWQASAHLFARAHGLAPDNLDASRGWAAALEAEGDTGAAIGLLERALGNHPRWIDGHKALATLRVTSGDADGFDASFADACAARPDDLALRLAWFHQLATARRWGRARQVIADGVAALGEQRAFTVARLFLASESDHASSDPRLFDGFEALRDPGLDLCRVRFWLRTGRPDAARDLALGYVASPAARTFWPYLSLAWRLLGDPRAGWLDGEGGFLATTDIGLTREALAALETTLRGLITQRAPYLEQSVRGGVQTGRHLFFNPDPVIQSLRQRITEAVSGYIAALPPPIAGHPLLSPPRDVVRYEGSWSVLLRAGGRHAAHTHKMGWISSALHIVTPPPKASPAPAGRLLFGAPPAELGLGLEPSLDVEPRPGVLVLFPSTLWHGTAPFEAGERLSVAFDVQIPAPLAAGQG